MWFGCKNSKSKNIFCYKNILSKKKSYQINSSSDVHLFLGITENAKGRLAGEISNLRSNWLIFRVNVTCQRMNYTSLNVRLHISVLAYINFSKFWFVFQHFTCPRTTVRLPNLMKKRKCISDLTEDRPTDGPDEEPKVYFWFDRRPKVSFWLNEVPKVSFWHGKGPNICPSHLQKDWKCPSDLVKDRKYPSDLINEWKCPWPDKLDLKRPSAWTEGKPPD